MKCHNARSHPHGNSHSPREVNAQENSRALGAVPLKGARWKRSVHDVETQDVYNGVTAATNMGKWHVEVEQGAEEFANTRRRVYKRESGGRHKREAE